MLAAAGIRPSWSGPPTPDEIHKLDQERLLNDPLLTTEDGSEDDTAMARALLAGRSAEDIAAALVRLYRSRLPAAEEVFDPGQGREPRAPAGQHDRETRRPARGGDGAVGAGGSGNSVWFRLNIGRNNNADPRWLLPMICRRGKITKQDIGAIRIFERETKFEVTEAAAGQFAASVRRADGDEILIEPLKEEFDRRQGKPPAPAGRKPRPGGGYQPGGKPDWKKRKGKGAAAGG